MKIILLKDVAKIGKRYETKNVADGYALNLLIPQGLAVIASPEAIRKVELEKARTAGEEQVHNALLMENLRAIEGKTVTISEKANEKGHLFAGIHKNELVNKIREQTKVQLNPEFIVLNKPIKEIGSYPLEVKAKDKSSKFTLEVIAAK